MNFKNIIVLNFILLAGHISKPIKTKLLNQMGRLENSLDKYPNEADQLIAKSRMASGTKEYDEVISIFSELEGHQPDSELYPEAKQLNYAAIRIVDREQLNSAPEAEAERQRIEAERQDKLKALNKLKKNFDNASRTTWYKNPYFTHYYNRNYTSIYFGSKPGVAWLRMMMSYMGEEWISFDKAFLFYDENTWEIPFKKNKEKKTDNGSGAVWEWIDVPISDHRVEFLMALANSKNAKMRLSGKYTKTRKLTKREKQGIKDVLNGYKALKEGIR